jgi:hypothetical protein
VYATAGGKALESEVRPRVDKAYAELRRSVDAGTWKSLITCLEQVASLDEKSEGK